MEPGVRLARLHLRYSKYRSNCARPFGVAQGRLAEGGCPHMSVISHQHLRKGHGFASAIIEAAPVVLFHICAEVVELADTPS
jgi:hypothetical protein